MRCWEKQIPRGHKTPARDDKVHSRSFGHSTALRAGSTRPRTVARTRAPERARVLSVMEWGVASVFRLGTTASDSQKR